LSKYIKCFWTLERAGKDAPPLEFSPVSDGTPGLIFQLSDNQTIIDGEKAKLANAFIFGQTIKRRKMELLGQFDTLGVLFFPNSLKSIFGIKANLLTDTCLDFSLITADEHKFLHERLSESNSTEERIGLLSNYFLSQIQRHGFDNNAVSFAVNEIQKTNGSLNYQSLLKDLKISERSLERHFKQHVGITPKMYMRICRFQASLSQLKQKGYQKLSDIAYENGYADQSHFIREFKEFLGFSPLKFDKKPDDLILEMARVMK